MAAPYFAGGGILGALVSWYLFGIPASDGYDFLALLAAACAAFDFGFHFRGSSRWRKAGSGSLGLIIFTAAFAGFAVSPYLLAAAYVLHTAGSLTGWWIDRSRVVQKKMYASFAGMSAIFSVFILFIYA